MWRYITLLHGSRALTDDDATLSEIGFVGVESVELRVVFATSTVTEVVLVTASVMFKKPGMVSARVTSASRTGFAAVVDGMVETGNFQSSTRLPVTWI